MRVAAEKASWKTARTRARRLGAFAVLVLALLVSLGPAASGVLAASTTKVAPPAATGTTGTPAATPEGSNGGAFNELSQGAQQETSSTATTETNGTSTASTSNSKKTVLIIIFVAIALLVAIGYVIVRDARRVAPASDPQVAEARSAHDSAATLRRRRAKAKAARQQRKRNR